MNIVILTGRLTDTPELKTTVTGVSKCTFDLAVDRIGKDENTDFIPIVSWRETAEFATRYLSKGRKVSVQGELRTRTYDDKDGKRRKAIEVMASRIEFADSRPQSGGEYLNYTDENAPY